MEEKIRKATPEKLLQLKKVNVNANQSINLSPDVHSKHSLKKPEC